MNIIKLLCTIAIVTFFSDHSSVLGIELTGYYENTLIPEYSEKSAEIIIDVSKLRLDFTSGGNTEEIGFNSNVNFVSYHTRLNHDLTAFLPDGVSDTLLKWGVETEISVPESRIYLDNAYLTWTKGDFRVRLGRQQLSWGPAYTYNPTDLFHRKDIVDPAYEKEGISALRADYRWGIGGQATGIFVPGNKLNHSGYALRIGTHFSEIGYDAALTLHHLQDSTSLEPVSLNSIVQRRQAVGIEFSGSLFGPGIWFEGNYNLMEHESDFSRIVYGLDYTFHSGLYVLFEGMYNGRANSTDPYPAVDWMENFLLGEPTAQHRFMIGANNSITDLSEGSIYLFGGFDNSFMLNPRIDLSISQNADMTLFAAGTFGNDEGQFSSGRYAITARVVVYF